MLSTSPSQFFRELSHDRLDCPGPGPFLFVVSSRFPLLSRLSFDRLDLTILAPSELHRAKSVPQHPSSSLVSCRLTPAWNPHAHSAGGPTRWTPSSASRWRAMMSGWPSGAESIPAPSVLGIIQIGPQPIVSIHAAESFVHDSAALLSPGCQCIDARPTESKSGAYTASKSSVRVISSTQQTA